MAKLYKSLNSQFKKKRFYSTETKNRSLAAFKKNVKRGMSKRSKKINDDRREAQKKTIEVYERENKMEELEELVDLALSAGAKGVKQVFDKDGNMLPVCSVDPPIRSNKYTKTLARQVVDLIASGNTVSDICNKQKLVGLATFRKWYRDVPEFKRQIDQAYTERADYYVDKLFELMEEVKHNEVGVKEATFVADNIKWIAERLHPKFMQKRNTEAINVQVNDDAKVQFQILLAENKDVPLQIEDINEGRNNTETV